MQRKVLVIISLVAVFLLGGFTFQSSKPVTYEYKMVQVSSKKLPAHVMPPQVEEEANALGRDGWELVSTQAEIYEGNSGVVLNLFFKRAK